MLLSKGFSTTTRKFLPLSCIFTLNLMHTGWPRKNAPPYHRYFISPFGSHFFRYFSNQYTKQSKCKSLVCSYRVLQYVLTSKVVKCQSWLQFVRNHQTLQHGHLFLSKFIQNHFFCVARGFYTHFSVCKVILNRFLKQKMDFSASEIGTKSKCVKFIKSVLPHLNL